MLRTDCSLLCPSGFSEPPRWALHIISGQHVPETAAWEKREIYFSAPQLLVDLLFVVPPILLQNVLSYVDIPGSGRQYWPSPGNGTYFFPYCPEEKENRLV